MADALSNLDLKSIIKMVVIFGMSELGGLLLLWLGYLFLRWCGVRLSLWH